MKIEKTSQKKNVGFVIVALVVVFLLVLVVSLSTLITNEKEVEAVTPVPVNGRNYLNTTGLDINKLIEDKLYLYNDDDVSVFAINDPFGSKVLYAYKDEPVGRQKTDMFFVHVFPKDSTLILDPFINFTFPSNNQFEKKTIDGKDFYLFEKILTSDLFEEKHTPFDAISHVNLGRFMSSAGRSLSVNDIKIPIDKVITFSNKVVVDMPLGSAYVDVQNIDLYTSAASYDKIKAKRRAALDVGVLLTDEEDIVKGEVQINEGEKINVSFRLKGDWTDHINENKKWSYRIIASSDNTILGMRKLSIQHPKSRNWQWEWLLDKVVKDEGVIGLRYEFVRLKMHIKGQGSFDNGIMALEESFDKILIENNKRREGLILGFDEDFLWKDTYYQKKLGLEQSALYSANLNSKENARVKVYNENKVLADPKLLKQFNVAKDLLEGLKNGKYRVSEVFDLDLLTSYVALSNLFGGYHGLAWHNLRVYYNPITNKLEPIAFDANAGQRMTEIHHYPFTEGDSLYQESLVKKLVKYSSQEYLDSIFAAHGGQLNSITDLLNSEFKLNTFDPKRLEYNSNFIKKYVYPSVVLAPDFVAQRDNTLILDLKNLTKFPIEITGLYHIDGQNLINNSTDVVLNGNVKKRVTLPLKKAFNNAFVSKKNKKGGFQYPKDVGDLRIEAQIVGSNFPQKHKVYLFSSTQNLDGAVAKYKTLKQSTFADFDFVTLQEDKKQVVFSGGAHSIDKSLKVPSGYTVIIPPGFSLDLKNGASFHSQSTILAEGTADQTIVFNSSDNTGGGVFVTNAANESRIAYCSFINLSNPTNDLWEVSGAVNFHESDVMISNTQFKDNRCEDALNIIRSDFTMVDSEFYNTFSDSFDGDFVLGTIKNCKFYDAGNDAIDVSGSQIMLENIKIDNPLDKGISAGEKSQISGSNITVVNGEIGIVSKDLSTINFTNVTLNNTRLGFSAFQKKTEYGAATIKIENITQINNDTDYLIESASSLVIDGSKMPTVSNKVIDQMYGNEYGKSSK